MCTDHQHEAAIVVGGDPVMFICVCKTISYKLLSQNSNKFDDTLARQNSNKFDFALAYSYLCGYRKK